MCVSVPSLWIVHRKGAAIPVAWQLSTAVVASALLGLGSFFFLLWTGVYLGPSRADRAAAHAVTRPLRPMLSAPPHVGGCAAC